MSKKALALVTDIDPNLNQLTSSKKALIVNKINDIVDLPFLDENFEAVLLLGLLDQIDLLVISKLKISLNDYLFDDQQGLDLHVGEVKDKLVEIVNEAVNIPVLDEEQETKLFNAVLDTITSFAKVGERIDLIG